MADDANEDVSPGRRSGETPSRRDVETQLDRWLRHLETAEVEAEADDVVEPPGPLPGELSDDDTSVQHLTGAVQTAPGVEIWDDYEALMARHDATNTGPTGDDAGGDDTPRRRQSLLFWMGSAVAALMVAVVFSTFVGRPYRIVSASMEPTVADDSVLAVSRVAYRVHEPRRGDVAVLSNPDGDGDLLKRVIGLPGETIETRDGVVYIDDRRVSEPYLAAEHRGEGPEIERQTLGDDEYFVLGDARGNSVDSRDFGPVPRSRFIGRAMVALWPPDPSGL